MEHIIQFGVTIDDDAIKKRVENAAIKEIAEDLRNQIFVTNTWNGAIRGFNGATESIVKNVFAEYKDEIIRLAAEMVADSMKRSKKYKEALAKVAEEMISE